MERRQGTLDQVFRARKRKHSNPVISSSKAQKNNYERAAEEIPDISPARKGSLDAFFFNARGEDPAASAGLSSGAIHEPKVPELQRGEVTFSSNKPWLTPCSLASLPGSAEGVKDPIKVDEETGSVERIDVPRRATLSPLKTQTVQPLPSPVKTQLIHSQAARVDEAKRGKEFSATVEIKTDTSADKKLDGAGASKLSQFANDFLSFCFSGVTPSYCSKSLAPELQRRKDNEGLPENAGRNKPSPELAPTQPTQGLDAQVPAPDARERNSVLELERGSSSFNNTGGAKEGQVERQVRGRDCCSDFNEDDDSLKGNRSKSHNSSQLDEGKLSLGPVRTHVSILRNNSHNLSLGDRRASAGSAHAVAYIAENRQSPTDLRISGFKFDPGVDELGINNACTPPETVLTQLKHGARPGTEERVNLNSITRGPSFFSTSMRKEYIKPPLGHETEAALVTPQPCNDNKHASASFNEITAGGQYYRSTLFSPGDEFWEEAIEIVMASKIDALFPSAIEKSTRGLSPSRDSDSDVQPPKTSRGVLRYPSLIPHGHLLSRQQSHSQTVKLPSVNANDLKRMSISRKSSSPPLQAMPRSIVDGQEQLKMIKAPSSPSDCLQRTTREGDVETRLKQFGINPLSPLPVRHFDFASTGETADHRVFQGLSQEKNSIFLATQPGQEDLSMTKKSMGNIASAVGKAIPKGNSRNPALLMSSVVETSKALSKEFEAAGNEMTGVHSQADVAKGVLGKGRGNVPTEVLSGGVNKISSDSDSSSSVSTQQRNLDLSDWLPKEVAAVYAKKRLTRLYAWQLECIQLQGVLDGRNLVYSASTSAGKSLVAELLMIRRVISTGRMALLVLPFVSICSEKAEHLEAVLEPLGKPVRNFFGTQGSATVPKDTSVAVCTIEKANSLINNLLEEDRLSEVCLIVIDELHMVGDRDRGYLLELLLTKIRYACGEFDKIRGPSQEKALAKALSQTSSKGEPTADLQIVGMSATMPNISAVADWLQAALFETEFRPVPLEEFLKVGNVVYNPKMEIARIIRKEADLGGKDPDHVVELCHEVVKEGHSVLVFCASRKACETSAIHIAKYLPSLSSPQRNGITGPTDGVAAIEELRKSSSGLDPVLAQTLPSGVAYHHAGLTVEEREVVERCFKQGLVRVLTATSTLAAGVNLPARRVIFRQPKIGREFLDGTRYRQMAGRAGRAGIDTKGESVLLCKPEEVKRIFSVLSEGCQPLQSCLTDDKIGMMRALLEVVAGGIVQTPQDVNRYVRCTLFNSTQSFDQVVRSVQDSLRWLCRKKFVEWNIETQVYSTTPLGRAAFGSSLSPEESLVVFEDLAKARDGFVLSSDLHLVYQVTPIFVELEPDWSLFYQKFVELSQIEQAVASKVGVFEPFLMRMAHGASMGSAGRMKGILRSPPKRGVTSPALHGTVEGKFTGRHQNVDALRVCRRFYVALMLSKLVKEVPLMEVSDAFKVPRGTVQGLQASAGRFAAMVSRFCERLGWHDLEGLVSKFQSRVSFGVRSEIVELTEIPLVKGARARALYKSGFRTVQAVAEATFPEMAKALSEASAWAAQDDRRRQTHQRMLAGVVRKIKAGAQRIVLERAEEARIAAFSAIRALGVDVPSSLWPSIQTRVAVAEVAEDVHDSPVELGNGKNASPVDLSRLGMDMSKPNHLHDLGSTSGDQGPLLTREGVPNTLVIAHLRNGRKGDELEKVDNETQGRVKLQDIDRRGANMESVIQKSKKAAGSTLNLNCLFGGVDLLKESVDEDVDNRLDTVQRINGGPVDVDKMTGGFDAFLHQWRSMDEFCFDLNFKSQTADSIPQLVDIEGIAICWNNSPVYYVSLSRSSSGKDVSRVHEKIITTDNNSPHAVPRAGTKLESVEMRWKKISNVLSRHGTRKVGWNLKSQLRALRHAGMSQSRGQLHYANNGAVTSKTQDDLFSLSPILLGEPYTDVHIAAWLLWPDEESSQPLSLEQEVKKRLPGEVAAKASRAGRWTNQLAGVFHNGCCRRVAQIQALHSALWKLLISEDLHHPLLDIEMPMVKVLAEIESSGIGIDMDACCHVRQVIEKRIAALEARAHQLAGTPFALSAPAEVANTLYKHLKLPVPPGYNKGKQHPSTNKHALDLLRHQHPIAAVIQEHRKLSKLLHSTLASIVVWAKSPAAVGTLDMQQKVVRVHQIFGRWLQTSTATGRLSMEEPNLQCVEKTIFFSRENNAAGANSDKVEINTRQLFIPTQDRWIILSADYSQIEVRLMAHFSEDAALTSLLSKPSGDLFRMITSQWTGSTEAAVTDKQREQTKRLVYGILYGMGVHALADQLDCSSAEASLYLEKFRSAFPGVHAWLQQACVNCRKSGYVTTLGGRKRFLDKINSGTHAEQAKAERQAVNSICQGSAADLIKMAMIKLHNSITGEVGGGTLPIVKGHCRLLLQIHDELLLEVDKRFINEVSQVVRSCMEGAARLKVPLRVNLQLGNTWGLLNPLSESSMTAVL